MSPVAVRPAPLDPRATLGWIAAFLFAAVASNLAVAWFGPRVLVATALLLIPLGMTVRDRLHDQWTGRALVGRMALLIGTGAVLSTLAAPRAGPVALASFCAFLAAETLDATVYGLLHRSAWIVRANGSNLVSSYVDSLVFTTIALGTFTPSLVLAQGTAKFVGGLLWSLVLTARPSSRP